MTRFSRTGSMTCQRVGTVAVLTAAMLSAVAGTASAATATCTWTGPSNGDWASAANWSCVNTTDTVPTSSDDVDIPDFGDPEVKSADASARTISEAGAGTFNIDTGFALTVSSAGSSSFAGHANINGTLNLNGPTTWTWAAGQWTLGASSHLTVNGALSVTAASSLQGSGVFHIAATGSMTTDPGSSGLVTVSPPLDNDGTVTVSSGTLVLANGDAGSTAGSYSIGSLAGATLRVDAGSFEAPSVTGGGNFRIVGAVVTVGPTDTFSPGTLTLSSGEAKLDADVTVANYAANSGVRDGTGTLTITDSAVFASPGVAAFTGGTTTIADTASAVTFGPSQLMVDDATLNLDAPATWNANQWSVQNNATLNVNAALDIVGGGSLGNLGGDGTAALDVGPNGSLTIDPGARTFFISPQLNSAGTVSVDSGTVNAVSGLSQTGGTTTVASATTLDGSVTLGGGVLNGNGTLGGPVDNTGGTLAPGTSPGTLTIAGDYTQGPGGSLAEEITGTTQGSEYDHLVVDGALTLDGALQINSTSFIPAVTDTFKIVSGALSRTGTFDPAKVSGSVAGSRMYSPQYDADGVTLTVTNVAAVSTSTQVTTSPTSATFGQSVTYHATVTGSGTTPTGSVTFTTAGGTVTLCTATLAAGSGSCSASNAAAGDDTVTGTYSGDGTFAGSAGVADLPVAKAASTTTVSSSPSSSSTGQTVTYQATVSDATAGSTGTPTGTVTFTTSGGAVTLCTAPLTSGSGSCQASTASQGSDSITGTYSGDSDFGGSTASSVLLVEPPPTAVADSYATGENTALQVAAPGVLGNDTVANGDTVVASVVGTTGHGTLTLNGNGSFAYTPMTGFVGSDTFSYRDTDTATGGTSGPATVTITVDATAPSTAVTSPTQPVQLTTTIKFCYAANDKESGVASYDVRYRSAVWDGRIGSYHYPTAWQHTTKACEQLAGSPGHEYCFSMRARDKAGLVSGWSAKRWCRAVPVDDRTLKVLTAGWSRKTGVRYYRHTFTTAAGSGAALGLRGARLHRLALIATRCPTCGTVDIVVNGVHHLVSTKSSAIHYRSVIFLPAIRTQLATIVVRTTSTHPVFVDGLAVIQV